MLLVLIFISSSGFALNYSPHINPDKFTICAITINSDDEKKVFASHIAKYPKKFNPIVELTDFGDDFNWFQKACKSKVRCDQLIISGHFGGVFFGENNSKVLPLRDLEYAGCSKTCENILSQPYEVFLFGCNTLASKEKDSRTRTEYLQTLLNDGFSLARAEMVVETRYGPLGDSNKSAMQRAFKGEAKQLYGFDSIGPSGKNVKGFLNDYFSKHSPAEHLEKLRAKRMLDQVDFGNELLAKSLKNTAFTQCDAGELKDDTAKYICLLNDSKTSIDRKLTLIQELLTHDDYLTYLPAMNLFFRRQPPVSFNAQQRKDWENITKNPVIKNQILGMLEKIQTLGIKGELGKFAYNTGFITKKEYSNSINTAVLKFFEKPMTVVDRDVLCSLEFEIQNSLNLKLSQFKNKTLGVFEIQALTCLVARDPEIVNYISHKLNEASDPGINSASMIFLAQVKDFSLQEKGLQKVKEMLSGNDIEVRNSAIYLLSKRHSQDQDLNTVVNSLIYMSDESSQYTAVYAYRIIGTDDKNIHKRIIEIANSTQDIGLLDNCLTTLLASQPKDPELLALLKKVSKRKLVDPETEEDVEDYLKSLK